jgi:hypothetical protein
MNKVLGERLDDTVEYEFDRDKYSLVCDKKKITDPFFAEIKSENSPLSKDQKEIFR